MNPSPDAARRGRETKRLAMFFDGTWNEPSDNTNVWRLYLMLSDVGADGKRQLKYYNQGVGTRWYDRLMGGAFGAGLPENVRSGYRWLMENYNEGDEVFLFGFSRGAFTARGLVGLVGRCGLLRPDAPMSFTQLFERYQKGDAVAPIYELKYFNRKPDSELDSDLLPNRPLKWLYDKACGLGLAFRCPFEINDDDLSMKPVDSYAEFLGGLWKFLTLGKRYVRWVQAEPRRRAHGSVRTVNERIDRSVFERWRRGPGYRPASLREWAGRKKVDIDALLSEPARFNYLWSPVSNPGIE